MKTVNKLQNHIHNYNYLYAAMHGGSGFALRNCWVAMALTPYTQLMHHAWQCVIRLNSSYTVYLMYTLGSSLGFCNTGWTLKTRLMELTGRENV